MDKDLLLNFLRHLCFVTRLYKYIRIFLPECTEECVFLACGCIECSRDRNYSIFVVLFIVREYHELSHIEERLEGTISHASVDSATLYKNTLIVVWLLHLNEYQRHTIDEDGYIWTEIVCGTIVFTCKLRGYMPLVV